MWHLTLTARREYGGIERERHEISTTYDNATPFTADNISWVTLEGLLWQLYQSIANRPDSREDLMARHHTVREMQNEIDELRRQLEARS